MDTASDGWLAIYLAVIPITAAAIAAFLGVLALLVLLFALGARAVLRAINPSHPITPTEEID